MNPAKNSFARKNLRRGDCVVQEPDDHFNADAVAVRRRRPTRYLPGDAVVELYGCGGGLKGSVRLDVAGLRELAAGCTALADEIEAANDAEGCTLLGGPVEEAVADWASLPVVGLPRHLGGAAVNVECGGRRLTPQSPLTLSQSCDLRV